jgi:phage/plasmid-associated DNA primase
VVTNIKKKTWFSFNENVWEEREIGPYTELSTTVLNIFKDKFKHLKKYKRKDHVLNCERIMQMLGNPTEKEYICHECLYIFYDNNFIKKLDSNPKLIPFRNGVLCLDTNNFRNGYSTDFLSIYINDDYEFPNSSTEARNLDKLIKNFVIFRQKHIRKRLDDINQIYFSSIN